LTVTNHCNCSFKGVKNSMDMKKTTILLFLLVMAFGTKAQTLDSAALAEAPIVKSLAAALKEPEKVYRLELKRIGLKTIPDDVYKLPNLQELNLKGNKIKHLPAEIAQLKNLEVLNVSNNGLETLPPEIGKLANLKTLVISQNEIEKLPPEMGELANLEVLDMWSNNIDELPKQMKGLKKLRVIDMRAISMPDSQKDAIQEILPNTVIHFSPGCNCGN